MLHRLDMQQLLTLINKHRMDLTCRKLKCLINISSHDHAINLKSKQTVV